MLVERTRLEPSANSRSGAKFIDATKGVQMSQAPVSPDSFASPQDALTGEPISRRRQERGHSSGEALGEARQIPQSSSLSEVEIDSIQR